MTHMDNDGQEQQGNEERRRAEETCPHPDRPNVLSLPSMGNPHCCAECFDWRALEAIPHRRGPWETPQVYEHTGWLYGAAEWPTYSDSPKKGAK